MRTITRKEIPVVDIQHTIQLSQKELGTIYMALSYMDRILADDYIENGVKLEQKINNFKFLLATEYSHLQTSIKLLIEDKLK